MNSTDACIVLETRSSTIATPRRTRTATSRRYQDSLSLSSSICSHYTATTHSLTRSLKSRSVSSRKKHLLIRVRNPARKHLDNTARARVRFPGDEFATGKYGVTAAWELALWVSPYNHRAVYTRA